MAFEEKIKELLDKGNVTEKNVANEDAPKVLAAISNR